MGDLYLKAQLLDLAAFLHLLHDPGDFGGAADLMDHQSEMHVKDAFQILHDAPSSQSSMQRLTLPSQVQFGGGAKPHDCEPSTSIRAVA
jgi:hypothetical protein